jgi:hypothetical protein
VIGPIIDQEFRSAFEAKPGWTRDQSKRTDYVLWWWKDTGRFCLVDFHALCAVFSQHWLVWSWLYQIEITHSTLNGRTWESEVVFVPRVVVQDEITKWQNGHVVGAEVTP